MNELSDWIWLIAVAFWLLARLLPRLFRRRSRSLDPVPASPKRPTSRGASRPAGERQNRAIERQIASTDPIEPR